MSDPERILSSGHALSRALINAAREEPPPSKEMERELVRALVAKGGARRARSLPLSSGPLFSAFLARDKAPRMGAGVMLYAAVFLVAVLYRGTISPPLPVAEPSAKVVLWSPPRGGQSKERLAEGASPSLGQEPELVVTPGQGPLPGAHGISKAPAAEAGTVAPNAPPAPPALPAPPAGVLDPAPREGARAGDDKEGGLEILPFGEGMTRPVLLQTYEPHYTSAALQAKVEGRAVARCVITTTGAITRCHMVKSLPHMDEAVLEALSHYRSTPVTYQGRAVNVWYVFPFQFKMR